MAHEPTINAETLGAPYKKFATFKATDAIALGELAVWDYSEIDGISVKQSTGIDLPVVGIALKAVAAGEYALFQTKGLNLYVVNSATNTTVGGALTASATPGAALDTAIAACDGDIALTCFGISCVVEADLAITGGVYLDCWGS